MTEEQKTKKWKKRLGFKTSIKMKWIYTSWYLCDRWDVPYDLNKMLSFLQETLESEVIFYKIEVTRNV